VRLRQGADRHLLRHAGHSTAPPAPHASTPAFPPVPGGGNAGGVDRASRERPLHFHQIARFDRAPTIVPEGHAGTLRRRTAPHACAPALPPVAGGGNAGWPWSRVA
jgi:hypothetical protein